MRCSECKNEVDYCFICNKEFDKGGNIICISKHHEGGHIHNWKECKEKWLQIYLSGIYIGDNASVEGDDGK